MFWVYSVSLWIGVLFVILLIDGFFEDRKIVFSILVITAVASGVYFQANMNAGHIIGNEYYSNDQSRYMVKVLNNYQVSINMDPDEFDDSDFRTMEYKRSGHNLNIIKDDVYFNYKNFVTGVTIHISDGNKKAQVVVKSGGKVSSKSPVYNLKK